MQELHAMQEGLIPREILFADPQKSLVKLSPDGKQVSFLAPYEKGLTLWIAPILQSAKAKPISPMPLFIHDYVWSSDSRRLLFLQDKSGDENWQLKGIDVKTGQICEYTPEGCQARLLQIGRDNPDEIIIALNQRDSALHDVYRCHLETKILTCLYENHQFWEFVVDNALNVRAGIAIHEMGGAYVDLKTNEILAPLSQLDVLALYYYPHLKMGFSGDNHTLYVAQSLESNTAGLHALEVSTGSSELLGLDPNADCHEVLFDPIHKTPIAFAVISDRKNWTVLNKLFKADFELLQAKPGDISILSQSHDNQCWLVSYTQDAGPIEYYYYNRKKVEMIPLFSSDERLKNYTFTPMYPKHIPVQDGLRCMSYLSLPLTHDTKGTGIPDTPLPLVICVHGGPHFRDFWGFNALHQWLADRGYAVLSVNYRSSTGFGKKHMRAGNGEWGGKIQQDLLEAKAWAIQQKITTPDRVAIMGRSYGGYVTLAALSMTPDEFCCGIDFMGFANLETLLAHFPPYWKAVRKAFIEMLGCDPDTLEGKAFLKERSPIHYADRIQKPLLIAHGGNDPRVLRSESDAMVHAMQKNHIPVTYVVFPDEGHQLSHAHNREAFHALVEGFLARHLGGKCEKMAHFPPDMQMVVDNFNLI